MKLRPCLILMINTVLLTVGCSRTHKAYYEDGKLKTIEERTTDKDLLTQIKFDQNGDTMEINHFTNNVLNGLSTHYLNDSLGRVKRIYTFRNGRIEGTASEYLNNILRFKWEYLDDKKNGDFFVYFNNGSLKVKGYYQSDTICFINEYDSLGNQLNTINHFDFIPKMDLNSKSTIDLELNFHKLNPFINEKKAFYALFKKVGDDSIKITKSLNDSIFINRSLISIPFLFKPSNQYYLKIALPSIENGRQNYIIYDLDFVVDSDSRVVRLDSCCGQEFRLNYDDF